MRTIVTMLSTAALAAVAVIAAVAEGPPLLLALLLATLCGLCAVMAWDETFWALCLAGLLSGALALLAAAQYLLAAGWPPLFALALGTVAACGLLALLVSIWEGGIEVYPPDLLVLRGRNSMGLSLVRGPTRVTWQLFRQRFVLLSLIPQQFTYDVAEVDLLPEGAGGAPGQRLELIRLDMQLRVDPERALMIFRIPNWPALIAGSPGPDESSREFQRRLLSQEAWQRVFQAVACQQIELRVRRLAAELRAGPYELSAQRGPFAEQLAAELGADLAEFGLILDDLAILRIDSAEARAAQAGRANQALAEGSLQIRRLLLQLAVEEIRRLGLPETVEVLELVMLRIFDPAEQRSVIRLRQLGAGEPGPELARELGGADRTVDHGR